MRGAVTDLYHYPVKGLSPQPLPQVDLVQGRGFPNDRVFAFARHDSGCDPKQFRPLPKTRFHMLARDAALAGLETEWRPESGRLKISQQGRVILDADLNADEAALEAAEFLQRFLGLPADQTPFLAFAGDNRFTDVSVRSAEMMNAVSLINLDSVRDFESKIGDIVDPMRFRANIYFEGWPAWSELDLVGEHVEIGDIVLRVCLRTKRCPATQVNPKTTERDIDVPALLHAEYGHSDLGIYAEVVSGGQMTPGMAVTTSAA